MFKKRISLLIITILTIIVSVNTFITYTNQSNWPGICAASNKEQSPVDIVTQGSAYEPNFNDIEIYSLNYEPLKNIQRVIKDSHELYYSFNFTYDEVADNFIVIKKLDNLYKFQLIGVHVHCPSEHSLNGSHSDCEFHLVHLREKLDSDKDQFIVRNTLVIGLLIEGSSDAENPILTDRDMDFSPYINKKIDFYHYEGSLTTPGCSEVVMWFVSSQKLTISKSQFDGLKSWITTMYPNTTNGNSRNIQALENRKIYQVKGLFTSNLLINFSIIAIIISFLFF